jgi:hypothetical protein
MPITIKNSAGGGVTLDSTTSSNETLQLPSGGGTLAPLASPSFTGNVGIGTSSPSRRLHVKDSGSFVATFEGGTNVYTSWSNSTGTAGYIGSANGLGSGGIADLAVRSENNLIFLTNAGSEAMRIDSSGRLLHQTTSSSSYPTTSAYSMLGVGGDITLKLGGYGTSHTMVQFLFNGNNAVGTIVSTQTSTAYNTSSDYRLKTDVQPMTGATDRVKLLKPCNFEWISDGTRVDGFLAHEAQEVVPEAVHGTKDAMMDEEYEVTPAVVDAEGNETTAAVMGTRSVPDLQGIDQSKLVPLLTATIQELIARIEALENV